MTRWERLIVYIRLLLRRRPKVYVDPVHGKPIDDPFYDGFNVEDISLYQRHFSRIIAHVDVDNYTKWSLGDTSYDRERLNRDDKWTYKYLMRAQVEDGIDVTVLETIVNQYYFADWLMREFAKDKWVKRVLHRKRIDDFPDAARLRLVMSLVSGEARTLVLAMLQELGRQKLEAERNSISVSPTKDAK